MSTHGNGYALRQLFAQRTLLFRIAQPGRQPGRGDFGMGCCSPAIVEREPGAAQGLLGAASLQLKAGKRLPDVMQRDPICPPTPKRVFVDAKSARQRLPQRGRPPIPEPLRDEAHVEEVAT
jgi:hypothetical protein